MKNDFEVKKLVFAKITYKQKLWKSNERIYGTSSQPSAHWSIASFNCLLKNPSQKELHIIKYIARQNGNTVIKVDNIVRKKLMAKALDSISSLLRGSSFNRKKKWIRKCPTLDSSPLAFPKSWRRTIFDHPPPSLPLLQRSFPQVFKNWRL